jgi:phosphopantothenoylcysteine decarboxylase/phosphopantothenate--cysteine ligase
LFANPIDQPGSGFGAAANQGWLLGPGQAVETVPTQGKLAVAHQLLTALGALLSSGQG